MTGLYLADIRRLARNAGSAAEKVYGVYPERMRRISRLARRKDRLRSLAGTLLLCEILGAPKILYGEHGKPYVSGGPNFSLSHSSDYAVLAVDGGPVGVDIERWVEDDYISLASAAFHEDERAVLEGDPSAGTFFGIWTLKESYLKMLGTGLMVDPAGFSVRIDVHGRCAGVDSDPRPRLRLYEVEGYSAALCLLHTAFPESIEEVSL
jgi:4'-phosphopantetheinyl transferase